MSYFLKTRDFRRIVRFLWLTLRITVVTENRDSLGLPVVQPAERDGYL